MQRPNKTIIRVLITALALPLVCLLLLVIVANTPQGRGFIEQSVTKLSAGEVILTGLGGRFPDTLQIGRLSLTDAAGVWLTLNEVSLHWSPAHLLTGTVHIDHLAIGLVSLNRLPAPSSEPSPESELTLPVKIILSHLHIGRIDLDTQVIGEKLSMTLDGNARLASLDQGDIVLALQRLDKAGAYNLKARLDTESVQAHLSFEEPERGLIAGIAGLQGQNPLSVNVVLEGPLTAAQLQLDLKLGELNAALQGRLDFNHAQADLNVTASAPAMQPHADIAWQTIGLNGKVQGRFTQPTVNSSLHINGLNIAGTRIRALVLSVQGEAGQLAIEGELGGLVLADSKRDLLMDVPLKLSADIRLDAPDRPVTAALKHPYFTVEGVATTAHNPHAKLTLALLDLKPLAALAGLELQGDSTLTLNVNQQGDDTELTVEGNVGITGGDAPIPQLLGKKAKIGAAGKLHGDTIDLTHFSLAGKNLTAQAEGSLVSQTANFTWQMALADLSALSATLTGKLAAQGNISGLVGDLNADANLTGEFATPDFPRQPLTAKLQLNHLPNTPEGQLKVNTVLAGAPLALAVTAHSEQDKALQITLDRATWKSSVATGHMLMAANATVPIGTINLRITDLADFQALLGQPLSGSVTAAIETKLQKGQPLARIQANADKASLDGTAMAEKAVLTATVTDIAGRPSINGQLTLDGITAGNLSGSAKLDMAGTGEALKLQLSAALDDPGGTPLKLQTLANLNALSHRLTVAKLQADWRNEKLHLLTPVTITYAEGITLNQLRLGLRQATLAMDGRLTPTLAMTASVDKLPASLLTLLMPELDVTGTLQATAELKGSLAKPAGRVTFDALDLRMQSGPGRALPAVKLNATAMLDGMAAQINARCDAGANAVLNVRGQAPLSPDGLLDLDATGTVNLKLLDPLLTAEGQRARGQITLVSKFTGTLAAPVITGTAQLANGDVRDHILGAHITNIKGRLRAENGVLSVDQFEGRAGQGTIAINGTISLLKPDIPVNLTIIARDARPLASDRLTATLNSDLFISGLAAGQMKVAGAVLIKRAEIRIHERMPANIAVLKITRPGSVGTTDEPSPKQDSNLRLNLTITATDSIFVRGRGVDAELAGTIKLRGTTTNPKPEGSFSLRRGQLSLVGKTLTFTKGVVSFEGSSLADPSLNFVASTSSDNITATLTLSGTANKPKILLSSIPELPQDEILARLLFSRSASNLSTMEMVQIGSAIASLSGVTSGVGDPLESVRKKLSLDRLSVGGADNALEAGRYVMPGVYVGAKQGLSSTSPQAAVQIDLTKSIKLEATIGTGAPAGKSAGTNSVGIIYQFEY